MKIRLTFLLPLFILAFVLNIVASDLQPIPWKNAIAPATPAGSRTMSLLDGKGSPCYKIVIPAQATIQEKSAAKELKDRLDSFGHGEFLMITDEIQQTGPELRIGKTARSEIIPSNVGFDGISICARSDGSLELQGGAHRGLVNAVYAFLEEDLGYRYWGWSPNAERIPQTLEFTPVTRSYTPPLKWREPFLAQSFNIEYSLRNRTDSPDAKVSDNAGGHYRSLGYVHTLVQTVSPDQHFQTHPEWFAMDQSGKRISSGQWCETNPELANYLIGFYLKKIESSGTVPNVIGITKRDGGGVCHCPDCEKINRQEDSEAASLLVLINRVAAGIRGKYPQTRILTFAYLETEKRPKNIRPVSNVIMMYCNTKNSWEHCLTPARKDVNVCNDVKQWGEVAPLVIWDYSVNFHHYCIPMPNMAVIADNIRFWVANNAKGIMTQGAYQTLAAERDVMRGWVISKLLWNPDWDEKKLMEDFIVAYFGKAAPPLLEYNRLLEDSRIIHAGKLDPFSIRFDASAAFLTDEFMAKAKALYREAHTLAGNDAVLNDRIDRDELPILYVELLKQIEAGEAGPDFDAVQKRFAAIARKSHLGFVGEKQEGKLADFLQKRPVGKSER